MTELPPTAIDAATRGVLAVFGADRTAASESIIRYALAAAAPHIAAAEREHARQLATRHDATGTKCAAGVAARPTCLCATWTPRFPFANLLTEGDTT